MAGRADQVRKAIRQVTCFLKGHDWVPEQCDSYACECGRCFHWWTYEDDMPFQGVIPVIAKTLKKLKPGSVKCSECGKHLLVRGRFSRIPFCSKWCEEHWIPF